MTNSATKLEDQTHGGNPNIARESYSLLASLGFRNLVEDSLAIDILNIRNDIDSIPCGELDTYNKDIFERLHVFMIKTLLSTDCEVLALRKKIENLIIDAVKRDELEIISGTNPMISTTTTSENGKVFCLQSDCFTHKGKRFPKGTHPILVPFVSKNGS